MEAVEKMYIECENARQRGDLIHRVSRSDKEFHFQNWVGERLDACGLAYDEPGRNTYPDYRLIHAPIGFEVKGLAWPGREADYDANSQVPNPSHNGRNIYYVFGRYPKSFDADDEYPVTDLVICHASFLNADTEYVHKNKSFRGFGSYGDILVRDRKMYVVPTPFALTTNTTGLSTLIVPANETISSPQLAKVGSLERVEVEEVVRAYEFDLSSNELHVHMSPNPNAGKVHHFTAYRLNGPSISKTVEMR